MAHATFRERPPRTNAPMQPRNGEKKMELVECKTCGSHSMTNGKCDYCGNQYKVKQDLYAEREIFFGNELNEELTFQDTPVGKTLLKIMIYVLVSIIWFAVTVFIPPLFIITICGLIIWICRKVCKKF